MDHGGAWFRLRNRLQSAGTPAIARSAARRQVEKMNPDLLPTKVVCPLPPLPAMPPPPLMPEYAPRPTRATGVRKSPNTEKLMAVWWQAKIDSVARAPLHQTAADDALQPRPPTGNAAAPRSTRDLLPSIKWSEVNSRTENVAHGYHGEGPHNELLRQEAAALSVSHQPRQLGDVGGDAPGLVAGLLGRDCSAEHWRNSRQLWKILEGHRDAFGDSLRVFTVKGGIEVDVAGGKVGINQVLAG